MTPDELAALHARGFTQSRPWTAAEFTNLLADKHTQISFAHEGFALWRTVADEAELLTIVVAPTARRNGVGFQLMQTWMGTAAHNAKTGFLEVAEDNAAALGLYDKTGFKVIGRRPDYYHRQNSTAVDALVMSATLHDA